MQKGYIQKALSGFYYVFSEGTTYQTRARGVFRKQEITPLVGDLVHFESENLKEGYVWEILPRKNALNRPPIANVEVGLIIMSLVEPNFSQQLLDRYLVHLLYENIIPVIIITKEDLASKEELAKVQNILEYYEKIGIHTLHLSARGELNEEEERFFRQIFKDRVSLFMGQSGAGKSTLLNKISPHLNLETGEISQTLGRGRHTTRHVELIPVFGGLVADTPGFSSLVFEEITEEELGENFPEIHRLSSDCKFRQCMHENEPQCAVKKAVETGEMNQARYEHYLMFLEEIRQRKPKY